MGLVGQRTAANVAPILPARQRSHEPGGAADQGARQPADCPARVRSDRIASATCTCGDFSDDAWCKHVAAIGYHIVNSCEIDPFYPFYLRQLDIAELSNIGTPKRVWEHAIQGAPQASASAPLKHGSPSASASQMMRMAPRWSMPSSAIGHPGREGVWCLRRPPNGNRSCGDVPRLVCLCASRVPCLCPERREHLW